MEERQDIQADLLDSFDTEWLASLYQHDYRRMISYLNESDAVKCRELFERYIKSTDTVMKYRAAAQDRLDAINEEINSANDHELRKHV